MSEKVVYNFELYPDESETLVEDILCSRITSLRKLRSAYRKSLGMISDDYEMNSDDSETTDQHLKQIEAELKFTENIHKQLLTGRKYT